jgi:hypothetical protein
MNIIQLILVAIRGLAVVTNNPAIGGGSSVRLDEASKLLNLLGELLERGDEAHTELKEFAEVIERMAKEGRAPTNAEWDTLKERSDAAHSVLQAALAEAEAEEEPEFVPVDRGGNPLEPTPAVDTLPDDDEPVVDPDAQ